MPPRLRPQISCPHHPARPSPRRHLTTPLPHLPPSTAYTHLPSRRLLLLTGHDAPHFLQGLTTRNIPPATTFHDQNPTSGFYAAFLNAAGRVLHDVFIYPGAHRESGDDRPNFMIEVDANEAERLARHLKRYKLRAKVDVRVLDGEEGGVWSSWGSSSQNPKVGKTGFAECADMRAPGMGSRIILPGGKKPELDAEEVDEGSYTVRRILKGVAEGQGEILRESALPLESNMDYTSAIDFRKGCYVGQELTIRTRHTGVVRKRILPVQLYPSTPNAPEEMVFGMELGLESCRPPQGTDIKRVDGKGRSTGKWLGGVGNVGLALCRLEMMTDVRLTGEGGQRDPGMEFGMVWPGEVGAWAVRVKAFVPGWHGEGDGNASDG